MAAPLNQNTLDTGTPPIPEAKAWLGRYDGSRGQAIDLSQAAPGTAPPPSLLAALARAAADPAASRYGPILGDDALRDAYAADVNRAYGGDLSPADVAITAGANMGFVATIMALAKAGDAVILPVPWYFNHKMTLDLLGIRTVALPCAADDGLVPSATAAQALIDSRVKAIVLVTPNNPAGAVYPPATIAAFFDLCARHGLWLVLDETYRDFLPEGVGRAHGLFGRPDWRDTLIGLYSFSKAYAIPGHRLGAITASRPVLDEIGKILDCIQICPPRIGQIAVAPAVAALAEWRESNRREINRRADAFRSAMQALPDWRVWSVGAYFAYVGHPVAGAHANRVAERLAVERGVLALPGDYFGPGQERCLRIAFANADSQALAGLPTRLGGLSP